MSLAVSLGSPALAVDFDSGVFEFQQKMATKGDAQAQYRLGVLYETGKGTKASYDEALAWYKKSASQNYKPAELRITYLDIKKSGYNKTKHAAWLKDLQAEANNSGEMMMLLASMHESGFIVDRNLNTAQDLLKKATFKNIPGSEAELERIEALVAKEAEQNKLQQAEQDRKRKAEEAKKAEEARIAKEKKAQEALSRQQSQSELQKKKLEEEKRRIAEEKRKLEEQRRALAEQQAKQQAKQTAAPKETKDEDTGFDTDPCKGPKARFMTMCK